jgi:SNF2 family DNA or RNA helicase
MSDLYPYQTRAAQKLIRLDGRGGLFLDMGTGKTRTALAIAWHLRCRRLLIVVPLSAVGVWQAEAALFWPKLRVCDATVGTIAKRAACVQEGECHAYLVGYETFWREPLRSAILKWHPHMVIYDEAHRLKGRSSKQSRFAGRLVEIVPRRLALTGTPMPNGPEDLYGLYRAIDPAIFGSRWADFERQYLIKGGYLNYQTVGYRNVHEIKQKLRATSARVTKANALDLPPQVDVTVPVTLDRATRELYDEMRKKAIAEVEGYAGGKTVAGITLARSVLTNILRLQTITGGWTKLASGEIVDLSYEKQKLLLDLLSDAVPQVGRVVIFCRFRHDIDRLTEALMGKEYTFVLDGRTPPAARAELLDKFRAVKYGYLIAQVAVASLSIDLTCSHLGVFYSSDYSFANYEQCRNRLHRHGQEQKVTYHSLVATDTVDERIYKALQDKAELSKSILDVDSARELFG